MKDIIGPLKKSFDVVKDGLLLVSLALNVYFGMANGRHQQKAADLEFTIKQRDLRPEVVSRRILVPGDTLRAFMSYPEGLELPGSSRPAFVETALGKTIYKKIAASRDEDLPAIEAEFLLFTNTGKVAAEDLRLEGASASTETAKLGALDPGTTKWFPVSLSVNETVTDAEPIQYDRFHFGFMMLGKPLAEGGPIPAKAIRSWTPIRAGAVPPTPAASCAPLSPVKGPSASRPGQQPRRPGPGYASGSVNDRPTDKALDFADGGRP